MKKNLSLMKEGLKNHEVARGQEIFELGKEQVYQPNQEMVKFLSKVEQQVEEV